MEGQGSTKGNWRGMETKQSSSTTAERRTREIDARQKITCSQQASSHSSEKHPCPLCSASDAVRSARRPSVLLWSDALAKFDTRRMTRCEVRWAVGRLLATSHSRFPLLPYPDLSTLCFLRSGRTNCRAGHLFLSLDRMDLDLWRHLDEGASTPFHPTA